MIQRPTSDGWRSRCGRTGARAATLLVLSCLLGCRRDRGAEALRIELVQADDSSFTTAAGENLIQLRAIPPAGLGRPDVSWSVSRGIGEHWTDVAVPSGLTTKIKVANTGGSARLRGPHPSTEAQRLARLERDRIYYRIVATARASGQEVRSDTLMMEQGSLAVIRQEYYDVGLRWGAPPATWFRAAKDLPKGLATGDFDVAAANPKFMDRLAQLQETWKAAYDLPWRVNSFYRNPGHNRYHVGGSGSGPVSNSWHQYGCAADLQTYPVLMPQSPPTDTLRARQFWDAMAQEALELDFDVEPRDKNPARPGASFSGVGHVHVELNCLP